MDNIMKQFKMSVKDCVNCLQVMNWYLRYLKILGCYVC